MKRPDPLVVLSAYTGVLMSGFAPMHEYIEDVMGHPVWTHQMADLFNSGELRKKIKERGDFADAIKRIDAAMLAFEEKEAGEKE